MDKHLSSTSTSISNNQSTQCIAIIFRWKSALYRPWPRKLLHVLFHCAWPRTKPVNEEYHIDQCAVYQHSAVVHINMASQARRFVFLVAVFMGLAATCGLSRGLDRAFYKELQQLLAQNSGYVVDQVGDDVLFGIVTLQRLRRWVLIYICFDDTYTYACYSYNISIMLM